MRGSWAVYLQRFGRLQIQPCWCSETGSISEIFQRSAQWCYPSHPFRWVARATWTSDDRSHLKQRALDQLPCLFWNGARLSQRKASPRLELDGVESYLSPLLSEARGIPPPFCVLENSLLRRSAFSMWFNETHRCLLPCVSMMRLDTDTQNSYSLPHK